MPEQLKKAYLATPYSHPKEEFREMRFRIANKVAAEIMTNGVDGVRYSVFSPISHSHPVSAYTGPQDHDFWMGQDLPWLEQADVLFVYPYDAEDVSKGVVAEVAFAKEHGIPVIYLNPIKTGEEMRHDTANLGR